MYAFPNLGPVIGVSTLIQDFNHQSLHLSSWHTLCWMSKTYAYWTSIVKGPAGTTTFLGRMTGAGTGMTGREKPETVSAILSPTRAPTVLTFVEIPVSFAPPKVIAFPDTATAFPIRAAPFPKRAAFFAMIWLTSNDNMMVMVSKSFRRYDCIKTYGCFGSSQKDERFGGNGSSDFESLE